MQSFQKEAGQQIKDLVITAPNTVETITISGKVVFENGYPKTKDERYVSVEFAPDKITNETKIRWRIKEQPLTNTEISHYEFKRSKSVNSTASY